MANIAGRKVKVQYRTSSAATPASLAGARTDGITINTEYIDITDKDDNGIVTYLDDIGRKSFEMTAEGLMEDQTIMKLAANAADGAALHFMNFDVDGIGAFAGQFGISSFEVGGADGAEAGTFSATFISSGSITYTSG